jgi:hypothetical protein
MDMSMIEAKSPEFMRKLIEHPGISLVITQEGGEVHFLGKKGRARIDESGELSWEGENPLLGYQDSPWIIASQLKDLASIDVSGDLIVIGAVENGRVVDLEDVYSLGVGTQYGAHGGLGGDQTVPFIISPREHCVDAAAVFNESDLYHQIVETLNRPGSSKTGNDCTKRQPGPSGIPEPKLVGCEIFHTALRHEGVAREHQGALSL